MNAEMAFFKKLLKKSFGRMWVHEFAVMMTSGQTHEIIIFKINTHK
jgi:hypothetical protein